MCRGASTRQLGTFPGPSGHHRRHAVSGSRVDLRWHIPAPPSALLWNQSGSTLEATRQHRASQTRYLSEHFSGNKLGAPWRQLGSIGPHRLDSFRSTSLEPTWKRPGGNSEASGLTDLASFGALLWKQAGSTLEATRQHRGPQTRHVSEHSSGTNPGAPWRHRGSPLRHLSKHFSGGTQDA